MVEVHNEIAPVALARGADNLRPAHAAGSAVVNAEHCRAPSCKEYRGEGISGSESWNAVQRINPFSVSSARRKGGLGSLLHTERRELKQLPHPFGRLYVLPRDQRGKVKLCGITSRVKAGVHLFKNLVIEVRIASPPLSESMPGTRYEQRTCGWTAHGQIVPIRVPRDARLMRLRR